ncbi:MAG: chromosome segregation protein SMC [Fidelibacterota bacterium]
MHISQLSLHGFKSFAKTEKLMFHEGITAVVGPNGCGKTNIVDAIRWVLGEQKYSLLRGTRIDDIIFNGSEAKKPLNVCQVSLLIHNTKGKLPVEYTDVEISRRAFRDGESEYMINRTPCRLKDIQNLFIDTGMGADAYSVIELKMIEDILSDSADDRRRMFEEAAGVNQYKRQRRTALNRLEATRGDLDRVTDIILEVEKQVDALRLQLKRFDRHHRLTGKIQERELQLAFLKKREIVKKLRPLQGRISDYERQRSTRLDEEKGREAHLEELQKAYRNQQQELSQVEKDLDDLAEKKQDSNNRILILKEQIKSTRRSQERLQVELEENRERKKSLESQKKELDLELENLAPRIEQKSSGYEKARRDLTHKEKDLEDKEIRLEHLRSRRLEHLKMVNSTRSNLERTQEILDEKGSRLADLETRVQELEGHLKEQESSQKELEKEKKELQRAIARNRKELEKLDTRLEDHRTEKHGLGLEFHRIANQVETLESQLQFYREIMESREGYPSGVRHVLGHREDFPDVLGAVADLMDVKEEYRPAVEAGLGPLARCLVCRTRKGALKVLDDLDALGMGSVSLIPLDTLSGMKGPSVRPGTGIPATDVVTPHKDAESLVPVILGDLVIVEDASSAQALLKAKGFAGSIADLSGRYYDRKGFIRSLKGEGEVSVLGRKEKIDDLDKAIDKWISKGNRIQEKLTKLSEELEHLEKRYRDLSEDLGRDIDQMADLEKRIAHNEFAISQGVESLKGFTHETVLTRKESLGLKKNLDRLVPRLKELEEQNSTYETKIGEAKVEVEKGKKEVDDVSSAVQQMRLDLINLENDRDNLEYRLETVEESTRQLDIRKGQLREETDGNVREIERLSGELEEEEKALLQWTALYRKQKSLKDLKAEALQESFDQIEGIQAEIRREQRERDQVVEELKKTELELSDYRGRLESLEERIEEKYRREIPDAMDVSLTQEELSLEIDRMERSIERIGPINMAVKEEYEEESQRLDFLQKQRKDLLESEDDLLETVRKIDKAARRQFLESFEKIRKNFQKTFTLFFEGGEGDLELRGDDDPLEADITIHVRPPGKRTRHLRMLSSGEKALSAIALLFAIYQVKPSPFCILDEVDAPLDDHNIRKFTRALNEFSRETQFIIVTHNKLTMESAKYLYGITMEQSGVSKIVSVKFD